MIKKIFILSIVISITIVNDAYARRGCCSWHGGVSSCGDNGRIICRDGTYSPTCGCSGSSNSSNNRERYKSAYEYRDRFYESLKKRHSYENDSEKIIRASRVSRYEYCRQWLEFYKVAVMLKGYPDNVGKAEVINQFDEAVDLWNNIETSIRNIPVFGLDYGCRDRTCFVRKMIEYNSDWEKINDKIENTYRYIVIKYQL